MSKAFISLAILCLLAIACAPAIKPAAPVVLPPKENRPPSAEAVVGPRELKPSSTVTVICSARDPDGDVLSYAWSAEAGSLNGTGRQVEWTAPAETGEFALHCTVSDGKGGEAAATGKFIVIANPFGNETADNTIYLKLSVPSGQVMEVNRQIRTSNTAEIECVVVNEGTGKYTYQWSAPVGKLVGIGLNDGSARRVGWTAPGQAGIYTVTLIVTDIGDHQAKGQVNFEVLCCRDPE